ncbi:MAG TPA: hypothetical protein PKY59_00490 [Pyrinomonadaceae bacterium]|nr:hypothetical protein [Pyrinomonadaceae bacterium]
MKKLTITTIFGLAMAIALGLGLIPSMEQTASCADCESDNLPGIKKQFETFDAECKKQLEAGEDQKKGCFVSNVYNKLLPIMKALGKDNRFGPGDRILIVGETQNGNLIAGANRGFQTVAPLDKDSMTIKINKTDGGNGALVKICTVDENGTMKRVGTINFAENNETGEQSTTVTGTQGKIVRVDIHSFGSAIKKFKYTMTTTK